MKKIYISAVMLAFMTLPVCAQDDETTKIGIDATATTATTSGNVDLPTASKVAFKRFDIAMTTGTTGLGIELSTPIHPIATLRTGFTFMPKVKPVMTFSVEGRGKQGETTKIGDMANTLQEFVGYHVDDEIDMVGEPTFYNFTLLVDVHPFKNKHWHLTAGVYLGPNEIANACNKTEEMPSLLALGIYNKIHDKIENFEPVYGDIYLDPDVGLGKKIMSKGRMGIYIGEFKKDVYIGEIKKEEGDDYLMEPDENGMVKVRMKTRSFIRPYLGFGYGGRLIKGDDRCYVSFDCGAMFWGGVPKVLTHDGVDLTKDLCKIRGQVNNYVNVVKDLYAYPVLNFKIAYRLF